MNGGIKPLKAKELTKQELHEPLFVFKEDFTILLQSSIPNFK